MAREHILIVEDEEDIQELIRFNLEKESFTVTCAGSGEEALDQVAQALPDLVLLDLMLPGMDGLSVCRALRASERTRELPVMMLTAKDDEADIVTGLELGADDYMTKPFSPRVLLARVRAVLRRRAAGPETGDILRRGAIEIDRARHRVTLGGAPLDLTLTEFGVLEFLARRPGIVFTRYQIVDAVKGDDYAVTDRAVDVQVVGLRKKLGDERDCIETVRGVGYRFRSGMQPEIRDA